MYTETPVLPCLQQLNRGTNSIEKDGIDCWFNNSEMSLSDYPEADAYVKDQKVSGLWYKFLYFYTKKFNWRKNVVCINKKADETLIFEEKKSNWKKWYLAIADPFLSDRNLAACVTHEKGEYIIKCFDEARLHIEKTCANEVSLDANNSNIDYFFDKSLVKETHPLYRECSKKENRTRNSSLKKLEKQSNVSDIKFVFIVFYQNLFKYFYFIIDARFEIGHDKSH